MKKLMIAILILLFPSPMYGWDDVECDRYRLEVEDARQEAEEARREAEEARREAEEARREAEMEVDRLRLGIGPGLMN